MKKMLAVLALSALAATVYAAPTVGPTEGVRGSVHDMNNLADATSAAALGTIQQDPQGRVCAFCHTPHHALTDAAFDYSPLWSHPFTSLNDPSKYTSYDSKTFNAGQAGVIDALWGPSRLCMSCHDGVIAADAHYNIQLTNTATNLMASNDWDGKAVGLNGRLDKTHPIGFDINTVIAGPNVDNGIDPTIAVAKEWQGNAGKKVVDNFYKDGNALYMTCATCHDVHNKDNVVNTATWDSQHLAAGLNYLVMAPQSGSQLCLTCHLK